MLDRIRSRHLGLHHHKCDYTLSISPSLSVLRERQLDLSIESGTREDKPLWLVHTCGMTFTFVERASAANFAVNLQERVSAVPCLPQETQKRWAAEHYRMLRGSWFL